MRIPAIKGVIDRRILANYRIDPDVMARNLPAPFRPKLVGGYAIGGICLIRLIDLKPRDIPFPCGMRSENAAHRIAVEWDKDGETREGVYIPRRDTDSFLKTVVGGNIFPGVHHRADFTIEESDTRYAISLRSTDGDTHVSVVGTVAKELNEDSVFENLAAASAFFEAGSLGYSDTGKEGRYDGLELQVPHWKCQALNVESVKSSYFEDRSRFPEGSVTFDCALLMLDIKHEWHSREDLCCSEAEHA